MQCRKEPKIESYIIRNHHEETDCYYCGQPLMIDDKVYECCNQPYCSKACLQESNPQEAQS